MPVIAWEFRGTNRIRNSLRAMAARCPEAVDGALRDWAQTTRYELMRTPYPPPPPGSRYRRTGRLARSWFARRVRRAEWAIGNRARGGRRRRPYASYVIGDKSGRQAAVHAGRWWKGTTEIKRRLPALRRGIERALKQELRRNGL